MIFNHIKFPCNYERSGSVHLKEHSTYKVRLIQYNMWLSLVKLLNFKNKGIYMCTMCVCTQLLSYV